MSWNRKRTELQRKSKLNNKRIKEEKSLLNKKVENKKHKPFIDDAGFFVDEQEVYWEEMEKNAN